MAEEQVYVEYLSLHEYIRNTPSDTEVHAEHQLRSRQEYLTKGKEYMLLSCFSHVQLCATP